MSIKVNEDSMLLEINGAEITAAVRLEYLWRVTGWPRLLAATRNPGGPPGHDGGAARVGRHHCWSFRA